MKTALVRLLVITAATLLLITLALIWLRFLGGMQNYSSLDHPLLSKTPWYILKFTETHPTPEAFEKWLETEIKPEGRVAWLDFRRTYDGHWILAPVEWVQLKDAKRAVHTLNLNEVEAHWPGHRAIKFTEVLSSLEGQTLWLNFIEKDVYWVKELVEAVPDTMNKNIIAHSPVKHFGKKLREAQPEWLFANDRSTLNQFLMLEGLYLETINSLWSDIFYAPAEVMGRTIFTERLRNELKRRKLPVVFELSEDNFALNQELFKLDDFQIHGLVSSSPEILSRTAKHIDKY